ncbi:MAG: hypothetical protein M3P12_15385 [Gemmatimonadota bacterium]|nr:hypothetical protein [Gemmatimonadota bacterium]
MGEDEDAKKRYEDAITSKKGSRMRRDLREGRAERRHWAEGRRNALVAGTARTEVAGMIRRYANR